MPKTSAPMPRARAQTLSFDPLRRNASTQHARRSDTRIQAAGNDEEEDFSALPENFCIIESRESVKSFSDMQNEELELNIQSRRNKIFLLMEEVRRLRIQQRMRMKTVSSSAPMDGPGETSSDTDESYPSFIPFFPPVNEKTMKLYTNLYYVTVAAIIMFGGLVGIVENDESGPCPTVSLAHSLTRSLAFRSSLIAHRSSPGRAVAGGQAGPGGHVVRRLYRRTQSAAADGRRGSDRGVVLRRRRGGADVLADRREEQQQAPGQAEVYLLQGDWYVFCIEVGRWLS